MSARAFAGWSSRMKAGAALLLVLALVSVLGPLMTADPARIVDPAAASLLPPGSSRTILERTDGSTIAAERAVLSGTTWRLTRRGMTFDVPASEVVAVGQTRFWLGTDDLGRDVLSRLLHGGRVSLAVGGLALALALVVGVVVGLASGLRGGVLDIALMRIVDGLLAVPLLFLLVLLAALFRPSTAALVLLLGLSAWMGVARLVRGQVLSLKEREFVLAARAIGASPFRVATVHLLPNLAAPLAQDGALRLGDLILAEAALSFLGLGVQPPIASWGGMVAQAGDVLFRAWWLGLLPGAAIALTVIATALLADGVAEAARAERPPAP